MSSEGRLADGSLRFVVKLPPELATLFLAEMKKEDRKKLPMARYIISRYFEKKITKPKIHQPETAVQQTLPAVAHIGL